MSGPIPQRPWKYVTQRLRVGGYFQAPEDGRRALQNPTQAVVWGFVIGHVLRKDGFCGVTALVGSEVQAALRVGPCFSRRHAGVCHSAAGSGPDAGDAGGVVR